jgi:hypothetical protein
MEMSKNTILFVVFSMFFVPLQAFIQEYHTESHSQQACNMILISNFHKTTGYMPFITDLKNTIKYTCNWDGNKNAGSDLSVSSFKSGFQERAKTDFFITGMKESKHLNDKVYKKTLVRIQSNQRDK